MKFIIALRLHGLLLALLLVGALSCWRNAYSVVPRRSVSEEDEARFETQGRDAAFALVHLLRRSIEPRDVVSTCINEWNKIRGHEKIPPGDVPQQMSNTQEREIVAAYRMVQARRLQRQRERRSNVQ